jgi:hypothetical protein
MTRRIAMRRSPIHGNGVFALVDIPAAVRLVQYRGAIITQAQADRRYDGTSDSGHTFLFILNERFVVDANVDGNVARWINHSCDPNCEAVIHEHDHDRRRDRVIIETVRAIRAGEEITYDYGIVLDEPYTPKLKRIWACRCGATNCSGTLLKPKRRQAAAGVRATAAGSRCPAPGALVASVLERGVFREAFVAVGVFDRAIRIGDREVARCALAVGPVVGAGEHVEVAGLVDQGVGARIGAGVRRGPERVALMDAVGLGRIHVGKRAGDVGDVRARRAEPGGGTCTEPRHAARTAIARVPAPRESGAQLPAHASCDAASSRGASSDAAAQIKGPCRPRRPSSRSEPTSSG